MITEEDTRFRHLERKVGIFIISAVVCLAMVLGVVGLQRGFFTKTYSLTFTVDRGTGFSKGMPVKLSGFRIGRITGLTLNEQAMVDISIEVERKYSKWIRSDSIVRLVREGLVGDNIVDVAVGSLEKPELKDGEALIYVKTKALDELADEIAQKVKPVLVEVRDIIGYINNPEGDLKKTVRNMELISRNLEHTRKGADHLISLTERNVESVTLKSGLLIDSANSRIQSLDLSKFNESLSKLPPLLEKTDTALSHINAVSAETRKLAEKSFPLLPGLIYKTDELLLDTDRLINNIGNSWLLGPGGNEKPMRSFRAGDSHD